MKSLKAAAIVVGSLAIAGAASPAFAADLPAKGLVEDGKAVARGLPQAAQGPTGALANDVRHAADGVKRSGMVKTPVLGGALPNPLSGKLPVSGGLPVGLPGAK
jgi:hypothetical protein